MNIDQIQSLLIKIQVHINNAYSCLHTDSEKAIHECICVYDIIVEETEIPPVKVYEQLYEYEIRNNFIDELFYDRLGECICCMPVEELKILKEMEFLK